MLLYSCSMTRALFLDLLPNLETTEFLASFKGFIARHGTPKKVYSDNGRTFIGAARWIKQVMQDEKFHNFLACQGIQCQFNLSHAPWWGGGTIQENSGTRQRSTLQVHWNRVAVLG